MRSEELGELVRSVRQLGVVQPLIVRGRKGRYRLIAGAKRLAAAAAAGLTAVPCIVHDVADARAREMAAADNLRVRPRPDPDDDTAELSAAVVSELTRDLGAITSCLHLLAEPSGSLRERVALDLIRAEASRAAWLADALLLLIGEPELATEEAQADDLVEEIVGLLGPECRLSGVNLTHETVNAPFPVRVDRRLAIAGIGGAVRAILGLVRTGTGGSVRVRLAARSVPRTVVIEVTFDGSLTQSLERVVDQLPSETAGGSASRLGLLAARRTARLHGGGLEVAGGQGEGGRVTMELPAAPKPPVGP